MLNMDATTLFGLVIAVAGLTVTLIIYAIQKRSQIFEAFSQCAKSLYSTNTIEQLASAILLRRYLSKKIKVILIPKVSYIKESINLTISLLRQSIDPELQKTLADGLSYAKNLDGQDMQYINMVNASIKPKYAIDYEISPKPKYLEKRLSMRNADLFHAVMVNSNINFLDARGVCLIGALLTGSRFHNCDFRKSNFRYSNISDTYFDQDCKLEGAVFAEAVGIDTSTFKTHGSNKKFVIADYLDEDGVFHTTIPEKQYDTQHTVLRIFVSKLGAMDARQMAQYHHINAVLSKVDYIEMDSIERSNYTKSSHLNDVSTHLERCDGCIILAFDYLNVNCGFIHKDIETSDNQEINNCCFASPWLHIETAMALTKNKPCLIIYDKGLFRNGLFEDKIVKNDDLLFSLEYSDNISKDSIEITSWITKVREQHGKSIISK